MTSALPNFLASCPPVASAGSASLDSAALAGLLPPAGVSAAAPATVNGVPLEFATLLPAFVGVVPPASPVATATITATATAAATTPVGVLPEGEGSLLNAQVVLSTETGVAPTRTFAVAGEAAVFGKTVAAAASTSVPESGPVRPHGISREEFEQAAAFVAALMQTLLPAAAPALAPEAGAEAVPAGTVDAAGTVSPDPAAPVVSALPVAQQGSPWTQTSLMRPNDRAFPANLPDQAKPSLGEGRSAPEQEFVPVAAGDEVLTEQAPAPSLALPNGRDFPAEVPDQAKPSLAASRSVPEKLPLQARPSSPVARPLPAETPVVPDAASDVPAVSTGADKTAAPVQSAPVFTIAADGAIELKLSLPASRRTGLESGAQPVSLLEVSAELELPGRAVVRVEATVPASPGFAETARPVNFAGIKAAEKSHSDKPAEVFERNFVFSGNKRVKTASPESGIAVAETAITMTVVPTEETRSARNPETLSALPPRADFQVVQSPAERITVAPTEPAGQNFAERAVATVTGLAEAQFAASMNKAGSVQLRLKFGGEDLSVRVELRDGAVHADFRTDSPELREALAKEWQAVAAAAPGHLQRFLDPVFSPASASASPDADTQQHASYRQPPQQQAQEQAEKRQDAWPSRSPFSRRSALGESFVPEPAAPRMPVLLPTSLRLSVLA